MGKQKKTLNTAVGHQTGAKAIFNVVCYSVFILLGEYSTKRINNVSIILHKFLTGEIAWEMTEFILNYMAKDKITILGHSWGTVFGANLVQAYPEYYDCYIGTGQLVDIVENEIAFKEVAATWAVGNEEYMELVNQLTPEQLTSSHISARNILIT